MIGAPEGACVPQGTSHKDFAPWYLIHSDDKRRARLNLISHFLGLFPYEASPEKKVKLPTRDKSKAYDDEATIKDRRWIKEKY